MFAELCVTNDSRSRIRRSFDYLREPYVTDERITVGGALPFHIIRARTHRGEIPWMYIEQAAGLRKDCMLLPDGVVPDGESGIQVFSPEILPRRLLANSAVSAIKKMRLSASEVLITIYDNGALLDIVPKFIMLAGSIRVITEEPGMYDELCRALMQSHGFSLLVGSRADSQTIKSTVIITEHCCPELEQYRGIIFTGDEKAPPGATVMRGRGVKLDEKLMQLVADGVDPVRFASAMYEKCGLKSLGELSYEYIGAWVK